MAPLGQNDLNPVHYLMILHPEPYLMKVVHWYDIEFITGISYFILKGELGFAYSHQFW